MEFTFVVHVARVGIKECVAYGDSLREARARCAVFCRTTYPRNLCNILAWSSR